MNCNCKDDCFLVKKLEKENAELDSQKNRNKSCYSCANATEKCFRNEIGCPCQKYKSLKEENAELKVENKELDMKRKAERQIFQGIVEKKNDQLTKAKEILKEFVQVEYDDYPDDDYANKLSKVLEQAEQFLKEIEK